MADPVLKFTNILGTLNQPLRSSGSDTSIQLAVSTSDPWTSIVGGVIKVGKGDNAEHIAFTGVTTTSFVSDGIVTLTGCTRGLKKNASSLTDAQASNKKDNAVGTQIKFILHSADINKYVQKDADNTISGNNTLTGQNLFSSTSVATLLLQTVTESQRDAFTGSTVSAIIVNSTSGLPEIHAAGTWYPLATGSTQPNATTTVAGKVEKATDAECTAFTDLGGTGASLFISPSNTTRLIHPGITTAIDTISIGAGANGTGNRLSALKLVADDTNTDWAAIFYRDNTGVNANTYIITKGTGTTYIQSNDAGDFEIGEFSHFRITCPISKRFTAGETLAAGQWVYLKTSDNKVWKAVNSSKEASNFIGVVRIGGNADTYVYVQETEYMDGLSGLTAGSTYYISSVAGTITATRPAINSASIWVVKVGEALTTTSLRCDKQRIARIITGQLVTNLSTQDTITVGFPIEYAEFHMVCINSNTTGISTVISHGTYLSDGSQHVAYSWGYGNGASSTSNRGTSDSYALFAGDITDGSGTSAGAITISSNNILITWTNSSCALATAEVSYVIKEAL